MSIDPHQFEQIVQDHMDMQPYSIQCDDCGETLDHVTEIDNDYDLTIKVDPCAHCIERAEEAARVS